MCNCIVEVGRKVVDSTPAELKPPGWELVSATCSHKEADGGLRIAIDFTLGFKFGKRKKTILAAVVPQFCPFCGDKYPEKKKEIVTAEGMPVPIEEQKEAGNGIEE